MEKYVGHLIHMIFKCFLVCYIKFLQLSSPSVSVLLVGLFVPTTFIVVCISATCGTICTHNVYHHLYQRYLWDYLYTQRLSSSVSVLLVGLFVPTTFIIVCISATCGTICTHNFYHRLYQRYLWDYLYPQLFICLN